MQKELPHSKEAEQSILGAMLIYPDVVRVVNDQGLKKEDFFMENHRIIFDEMMNLAGLHKPVDVTSLLTRLKDIDQINTIGGMDYILQLSDTAVSSANSMYYIDIIKERSQLRKLIATAEQIVEDGFQSASELDDILDQAEQKILGVTRSKRGTEFKSSKEVVKRVMDELDILRHATDGITGIKTGYNDLDHITNGFQRGDLIILAARPSMGKTAFALNVALQASYYTKNAVAIFSLEMPAEALMKRMLSAKSSIESSKLRTGSLSNLEFNRLSESAAEMMNGKIFIDDSASIRVGEIFSKCRKLKSEHGLDMIVIDYLQLISGNGRNVDNRQQEVSEISRSLKALAREMECPVIALSQLSRSVEARSDRHPMLSDLRESGAIEQDADIVMFLYRDNYYNKEEQDNDSMYDKTDLDIAKHRNGATGRVEFLFRKEISAFYNAESE